jgi:hypothetical protein
LNLYFQYALRIVSAALDMALNTLTWLCRVIRTPHSSPCVQAWAVCMAGSLLQRYVRLLCDRQGRAGIAFSV